MNSEQEPHHDWRLHYNEGEVIETDSPDLKPGGKVTINEEGNILVGGWKIQEGGYYAEASTMKPEEFSRMVQLDRDRSAAEKTKE